MLAACNSFGDYVEKRQAWRLLQGYCLNCYWAAFLFVW